MQHCWSSFISMQRNSLISQAHLQLVWLFLSEKWRKYFLSHEFIVRIRKNIYLSINKCMNCLLCNGYCYSHKIPTLEELYICVCVDGHTHIQKRRQKISKQIEASAGNR